MKKSISILISTVFLLPVPTFALANPATVYCGEHGGALELSQKGYGICKFSGGTECEEWAYLTGACVPGQYTDWAAAQSKDPDFIVGAGQAGWVSNSNGAPNYVDEKDATYFYYQVIVENRNSFSSISKPVQLVVYGSSTETFTIPPLGPNGKSDFFDFFIPVTKTQKVDMEINRDRSVKELDYTNNTLYLRHADKNGDSVKNSNLPLILISSSLTILLAITLYLKSKKK